MSVSPGSPPVPPAPGLAAFTVRQRLTALINRYEIHHAGPDWSEAGLIALAEQKRFAFKEQVTFFADAGKTRPVFGFKARSVLDFGAGYDVTDEHGRPIGFFKKQFGASLLRSTWSLESPDGIRATGTERNPTVAVLRRVWDLIPLVGEIPVPFLFHFDFRDPSGAVVLSSTKKVAFRDVYRIEVPEVQGRRLDWRVAAAMAVALDALQSR